ncbi:hypothetical protein [Stratiformator vulcanicus]|uniref:Uncharacterized protein n=1 Tax=Stratiformator vulcanicus TaxID=2527980 RepID=A0A517QZY0_9PLAN|nr:hypothetical protein [Stratiformator vulcanicus]QDT37191.1 hypothetical protein Pan189_15630 [Stratiformator vulcanicus]
MLQFLSQIDRRWVFLAMLLAVGVPVLTGLTFPETPSPMVRSTYKVIEDLPAGSKVLLALDYDPGAQGELKPMTEAFTRHCSSRGHRLILVTTWPQAPRFTKEAQDISLDDFPDRTYGEDVVNLGFRTGEEGVIKGLVNDLPGTYAADVYGTSVENLPLTKGMKSIQDVDLIISVSGGYPGAKEWVQYAATPYGIKMVAGTTGVQTPYLTPYVPDQLSGILGAIKSAAEYEFLLKKNHPEIEFEALAMERMGPQHSAHLLMIFLIIAGNAIYFTLRRRPFRTTDETERQELLAFSTLLLRGAFVLVLGGVGLVAVGQLMLGNDPGARYERSTEMEVKTDDGSVAKWTEVSGAEASEVGDADVSWSPGRTIGVWIAALLTLAVFSFLYGDNPLYKTTESIFVGVSAGYYMVASFWNELIANLFGRLLPTTARDLGVTNLDGQIENWDPLYIVPLILSLMVLTQLIPGKGWIARWPLAFFIGATAGIKITAFFEADFIRQIQATVLPLIVYSSDVSLSANFASTLRNLTIILGVTSGLTYFFFSAEQRGAVGGYARIGILMLMITFGAAFAFTVMGRIALLVERLQFLFVDWLRLVGG